jgi:uncharacterized protein (TIGR02118 family)
MCVALVLRKDVLDANLVSQGSTPPYIVCTTIYWDSVDNLKAALGAPEAKETSADVARFTNVYPTIWISDVVGSKKL